MRSGSHNASILLLAVLTFTLILQVHAPYTVPKRPVYFPLANSVTLTFQSSLLPATFTTLYRDTANTWRFNTTRVSSTTSLTFTVWHTDNWLNYTSAGAGIQQVYYPLECQRVYFDGVEDPARYSVAGGTTTITTTGSEAVALSYAAAAAPTGTGTGTFILYVNQSGGIGFQHDDEYLVLEVTAGALNSSNAALLLEEDHGRLTFTNNETVTFRCNYTISRVTVDSALIQNGESVSKTATAITIEWWDMVEPFLPYMFILGMVGLMSMFGGGVYAVTLFKRGEHRWALVQGVTFIAIGFGLFIAWVYAL